MPPKEVSLSTKKARNKRANQLYHERLFSYVEHSLVNSVVAFGGATEDLKRDRAAAMMLLSMVDNPICPKFGKSLKNMEIPRILLDVLSRDEYYYSEDVVGTNTHSFGKMIQELNDLRKRNLVIAKELAMSNPLAYETDRIEKGKAALNIIVPSIVPAEAPVVTTEGDGADERGEAPVVMTEGAGGTEPAETIVANTMKATTLILEEQFEEAMQKLNKHEKRRKERGDSLRALKDCFLKVIGDRHEEINEMLAMDSPSEVYKRKYYLYLIIIFIYNFN
jgi:hypothetical protein